MCAVQQITVGIHNCRLCNTIADLLGKQGRSLLASRRWCGRRRSAVGRFSLLSALLPLLRRSNYLYACKVTEGREWASTEPGWEGTGLSWHP